MTPEPASSIARHRTAIVREGLSRPLRLALSAGLLPRDATVLDYGCGKGGDLSWLEREGYDALGWDPVHRPDGKRRASDIVNLGYVINVIEDPAERRSTLASAWRLARRAIVVSAMVKLEGAARAVPFGDGVVTSHGTFQKYFDQQELESYIRDCIGVEPVALGMGVFAAARDPSLSATLLAAKFRHRPRHLDEAMTKRLFELHQQSLEPLIAFLSERGRPPRGEEMKRFEDAVSRFGSSSRALGILRTTLPPQFWANIQQAARSDLLVYLALSRFGKRPSFSELDETMREDVRAHFGGYGRAVSEADTLLFSVGQPTALLEAARAARVGKLLPDSLYVHADCIEDLPAALRVYEGCARRYVGGAEGANLVKLNLANPSISYLSYPDFDRVGHPPLARSMHVNLQSFRIRVGDMTDRANPPILHRKELFVSESYPGRKKFAALTKKEEAAGLYSDVTRIGTRDGWHVQLAQRDLVVRGHQLMRSTRPRRVSSATD